MSDNSGITLKQAVRDRLEENDYEGIVAIAKKHRSVMGILIRLAYDKDTLVGWRSICAIGCISRVFVLHDYEFLRATIRKLLWSLSDESGGIGWTAPEILGEIVSADPGRMADIIPLIAEVYSIEEKTFRPGVLYAFKRIAEVKPEAVLSYRSLILQGLSDQDPLTRIYALELISVLMKAGFLPEELLNGLRSRQYEDRGSGWVYRGEGFENVDVGEYSRKLLESYAGK